MCCVTVAFTMTQRSDKRICINAPAHSTALVQVFFGKASHYPVLSVPLQPRFGSLRLLAFPKANIAVCKCEGRTVHKLSQRRLTAERLALRESDCSRMRIEVSSDWLPNYIEAMQPVREIFKMAGYFPDRPRNYVRHN